MNFSVKMTNAEGDSRLAARYYSPQAYDENAWGPSPLSWDGHTGSEVSELCTTMLGTLAAVEAVPDVINLLAFATTVKEQCDAAPDDSVAVL